MGTKAPPRSWPAAKRHRTYGAHSLPSRDRHDVATPIMQLSPTSECGPACAYGSVLCPSGTGTHAESGERSKSECRFSRIAESNSPDSIAATKRVKVRL